MAIVAVTLRPCRFAARTYEYFGGFSNEFEGRVSMDFGDPFDCLPLRVGRCLWLLTA